MLEGIFPVIPTLFTDRNALDLDAQRRVIRFALNAGAHGLVFPGVASEYSHLSLPEREQLLALVAVEAAGRVPLVGGASATTAAEVIAAGSIAMKHGIRHLMIMAPVGLGSDAAAHRAFFQQVASGLPGAEIILQNAPVPTGAGLDPQAIIAIAAGIPAITYIKEETLPSGPAITVIREARIPSLQGVFGGGGARYIIDELDRGACGAMPAVELTDLHVALWRSYAAGDQVQARRLYRLSLPLLVAQAIYRMRLTKHVLAKRGIADARHVRATLPAMDAFAQRDVDTMLADLLAEFPAEK
ncbi:MAG: dihydrodipicolinate synthase family protein [Verrucomicrobia bacterium]|nr:dihydrodipicolinate synthase family protein [Verrucomicrobiota bacterium]